MDLPNEIILAEPRGFCAGVDRAIEIVDRALQKFGRPIYVRHEIVHNTYVVNDLKARGAIFIEELDRNPGRLIPEEYRGKQAHGVSIDLNQPMKAILAELSKHPVSTPLLLNGTIIVGRDIAHAKFKELIDAGKPVALDQPFARLSVRQSLIVHAGLDEAQSIDAALLRAACGALAQCGHRRRRTACCAGLSVSGRPRGLGAGKTSQPPPAWARTAPGRQRPSRFLARTGRCAGRARPAGATATSDR